MNGRRREGGAGDGFVLRTTSVSPLDRDKDNVLDPGKCRRIFPSFAGRLTKMVGGGILLGNRKDTAMKKVRITVLKTTFDQELAEEYGIPGLTPCPMHRAGESFLADYAKPEGLCDEAWKAMYQYVFALAHGAGKELFYYGDWIRKPGVAICSCNDGLRPVIFKLEATEEEAGMDYTPIR